MGESVGLEDIVRGAEGVSLGLGKGGGELGLGLDKAPAALAGDPLGFVAPGLEEARLKPEEAMLGLDEAAGACVVLPAAGSEESPLAGVEEVVGVGETLVGVANPLLGTGEPLETLAGLEKPAGLVETVLGDDSAEMGLREAVLGLMEGVLGLLAAPVDPEWVLAGTVPGGFRLGEVLLGVGVAPAGDEGVPTAATGKPGKVIGAAV